MHGPGDTSRQQIILLKKLSYAALMVAMAGGMALTSAGTASSGALRKG